MRAKSPASRPPGSAARASGRLARPLALAWLGAGLAAYAISVLVYHHLLATNPTLWGHTDEFIYRAAGIEVHQHPADVYRALYGEPDRFKLAFTYPPIAALVFALFSSFSFAVWQSALVVIDVLLLPVICYASLRVAGRRGLTAVALAFAVAAMALWLEPVYMTMYFGQINLLLLVLAMVDLALPDSCRWKGIGIGIAAGMKLTPLVFIPFLLASRRIRAGLVAVATFLVTAAVGFIALPASSHDFWFGNFVGKSGFTLQNQSIDGILQRLLPGHPAAHAIWLAAALVVGVAGLTVAVLVSRRGYELSGIVLCAVTGLLISPISWTHHWVWAVVPGLVLVVAGDRRRAAAAPEPELDSTGLVPARSGDWSRAQNWILRAAGTAVLLFLFVMWPHPAQVRHVTELLPHGLLRLTPNGYGVEKTWHGWQLISGNYYVITGAFALAGAAVYLWAARARSRP
ncbi:MAG TPA: glycosyltransferase 87 family protein [Streptosporangiaceae bacterium]